MHLYDYQSSVNNITMCWIVAACDLFVSRAVQQIVT